MPVKLSTVANPQAWWGQVRDWHYRRMVLRTKRGEPLGTLRETAEEKARLQCVFIPEDPWFAEKARLEARLRKRAKVQDKEGIPQTSSGSSSSAATATAKIQCPVSSERWS